MQAESSIDADGNHSKHYIAAAIHKKIAVYDITSSANTPVSWIHYVALPSPGLINNPKPKGKRLRRSHSKCDRHFVPF